MNDVFISHAHEDKTVASKVHRDLTGAGIVAWIDQSRLYGGHVLINEVQIAIEASTNLALVWSKDALSSRWVNAEWQAAWHLEKTIIPCRLDNEPTPLFLRGIVHCNFRKSYREGIAALIASIRRPPPTQPSRAKPFLSIKEKKIIQTIYKGQEMVLENLGHLDLPAAQRTQLNLDKKTQKALNWDPNNAHILSLAGYHKKNAFMIKHWEELQSGNYPFDKLLEDAESLFYKSLAVEPDNPSAVNGLGSVLMLRGDLDAAEFFVRRALVRAQAQGFPYPAAEEDLKTILRLKRKQVSG